MCSAQRDVLDAREGCGAPPVRRLPFDVMRAPWLHPAAKGWFVVGYILIQYSLSHDRSLRNADDW
jgi:hypothetical protein